MRFIPLSRVTSGGQILKSSQGLYLESFIFYPSNQNKLYLFIRLLKCNNGDKCGDKRKTILPLLLYANQ